MATQSWLTTCTSNRECRSYRLGTHAFYSILARKNVSYLQTGILRELKSELELRRYRVVKRRLSRIARASLTSMLTNIRF